MEILDLQVGIGFSHFYKILLDELGLGFSDGEFARAAFGQIFPDRVQLRFDEVNCSGDILIDQSDCVDIGNLYRNGEVTLEEY